ncbi:hypothetical protein EDD86DRAFT_278861 [Gorgonomyces haynaldii]|nr:hypothetical protein EDD86DRAFT_278861 [Gorgonomyces haynaldii]
MSDKKPSFATALLWNLNSGSAWVEMVGALMLLYGFVLSNKKGLWKVLFVQGITSFLGVYMQNVFQAQLQASNAKGWGMLLAFNEINWILNSGAVIVYSLIKLQPVVQNQLYIRIIQAVIGVLLLGYSVLRVYIGILRAQIDLADSPLILQAHSYAFIFWALADVVLLALLIYNTVILVKKRGLLEESQVLSKTILSSSIPRFLVIILTTFLITIIGQLLVANPTSQALNDWATVGWMLKGTYPLILLFDMLSTRELLIMNFEATISKQSRLNPAFQSTLHFERFQFGKVNRAYRKCNSVGQNFAIACSQWGEGDKVTVLQCVGGMTGEYIKSYLDEFGIEHYSIDEPAGRVDAEERQKLEKLATQLLTSSPKLEGIALCGTLPAGITGSTYINIAQLKPPNCLLFLDAFQNIEVLDTGKVDILKINAEEARYLTRSSDEEDLTPVAIKIFEQYHIKILAITNGPLTAVLFERTGDQNYTTSHFSLPSLESIVNDEHLKSGHSSPHSTSLPGATGDHASSFSNLFKTQGETTTQGLLLNPLGAGDTCGAIFFLEYLDTRNAPDAFVQGLAAASASCLVIDSTSHFDKSIQKLVADAIQVQTHSFVNTNMVVE